MVTFSDLSTWNQDKTIINGGNITTGQIHNLNYTTVYDLDNAWIRMGTSDGNRVYIDKSGIQWYGGTATSSGMSQGVIQNGLKTTTEGDTTISARTPATRNTDGGTTAAFRASRSSRWTTAWGAAENWR